MTDEWMTACVSRGRWHSLIKGRVVDSDTGLGMAGVPVGYALDWRLINDPGPSSFVVTKTTDAAGYYSFSPYALDMLQCVGIWGAVRHNSDGYSVYPVYRLFHSPVRPAITAVPAPASSRVGRSRGKVGAPLVVNGTVRATVPGGIHLVVQQLHGRTAWRAVAYTTVRASGRWSSAVIPTTEGPRNVYRVASVPTPAYVVGTSRAFVLTGTRLHKGCSYTLGTTPPPPW
jgi:hypothetical protein